MENTRRYGVIVCDCCHLDSLYDDLETPGGTECIPEREVNCAERKPTSTVTLYDLTDEEADNIRNDDRVIHVEDYDAINSMIVKQLDYEQSSTNYDKGAAQNADHINWGLLRCTEGTNRYAWGADGFATQTGISTVTCSGKNVDVVIVDTTVDGNHPEFAVNADGTGGSRFVRYNWFQHRHEVNSDHPAEYDYDSPLQDSSVSDHATHCAGTVAGNTQGWARDANIYNIDVFGSGNLPNLSPGEGFEYVKQFHLNKPINPETGRRNPTIINNSWSVKSERSRVRHVSVASTGRPIEQVSWRGTTYDGPFTLEQLESFGIMDATTYGGEYGEGRVRAGGHSVFQIVAAQEMIAAGVISVGSAGNDKTKICKVSSDQDWSNAYLGDYRSNFSGQMTRGSQHYHRGNSVGTPPMDSYPMPIAFPKASPICVGATNSAVVDAKRSFSNCGPRVDVYGPGTNIQSARHSGYGFVLDPRNSEYGLSKQNGTSMSGPQICGLLACVLEIYPRKTMGEIREYMETYFKQDQLLDTSGGYTDENSLQGGANLYAFHKPEREKEGVTIPRIGEWIRPSSGQLWPRQKYLY
tara:strand:+ start:1243 stop:2982 length:1740 start_codon:yes stop_codon:yes gene_type:complete